MGELGMPQSWGMRIFYQKQWEWLLYSLQTRKFHISSLKFIFNIQNLQCSPCKCSNSRDRTVWFLKNYVKKHDLSPMHRTDKTSMCFLENDCLEHSNSSKISLNVGLHEFVNLENTHTYMFHSYTHTHTITNL